MSPLGCREIGFEFIYAKEQVCSSPRQTVRLAGFSLRRTNSVAFGDGGLENRRDQGVRQGRRASPGAVVIPFALSGRGGVLRN
jgi:hypothetical protein